MRSATSFVKNCHMQMIELVFLSLCTSLLKFMDDIADESNDEIPFILTMATFSTICIFLYYYEDVVLPSIIIAVCVLCCKGQMSAKNKVLPEWVVLQFIIIFGAVHHSNFTLSYVFSTLNIITFVCFLIFGLAFYTEHKLFPLGASKGKIFIRIVISFECLRFLLKVEPSKSNAPLISFLSMSMGYMLTSTVIMESVLRTNTINYAH
jgi:hypothetical protein